MGKADLLLFITNEETLKDINLTTKEGKLLIAAIGRLSTTREYQNRSPDEIVAELIQVTKETYSDE